MLRDEPMNSTVFRILFDINPLLRRANFFKTKLCPSLQFYLIRICNFSMNCQYSSEASQPEPEESGLLGPAHGCDPLTHTTSFNELSQKAGSLL